MSSTQGQLVLVLMGATAAAPWAALALDSRTVRAKLARRKARRTLRAAGFRTAAGRTASITELPVGRAPARPGSVGSGGALPAEAAAVRDVATSRGVVVRRNSAIGRRSALGRAGAVTPLFSSTVDGDVPGARTVPAVAPPEDVFVSVGAVVALPDEPPGLAA
ncbi:hypothetical protein [Saccharopolyspora gregorii]|uniref:Uncharacterized protein n=1 Tax=Saccharopolyspora gregorii TaxID=33914 RepID=A0ABP6RMR5_9PSEU